MSGVSGLGRAGAAAVMTIAAAAATLLAVAPLYGAFLSAGFWIAALVGTAAGTALALAGSRWRWHPLVVAAAVVAAYFGLGAAAVFRAESVAGIVPTPAVLSRLAFGAVQVWRQVLTLPAPFTGWDELTLAPFAATLVVSAVTASIVLRARWWALAALPPLALFVFAIAFSTETAFAPVPLGIAFAALLTGAGALRRRPHRPRGAVPVRAAALRVVAAAGVLMLGVVAAAGAGAAAAAAPRSVLREEVVPPLELHDYASPLTSFRRYTTLGEDATLFEVSGLPAGAAVRLATLDVYDGTVYGVSGGGGAGAGIFERVGGRIDTDVDGAPADVQITVVDLRGVWVPTVGYATGLRFSGADAETRADALHYNASTGTAVATTGLAEGDSYRLTAVVPVVDEARLADARVAAIATPPLAAVPEIVGSRLDEVAGDAATPLDQIRAVQSWMQTTGFFSNGLAGAVASPSGHGARREGELLAAEQMVGDDEQYAVAMALMLSQLGLPVRVVMGFQADDPAATLATVTGADVHAWVEVPFEGLGWVPFDATPSEDRVPQEQVPQQQQKPRAQVPQPPDPPEEPAVLPPAPPADAAGDDEQPADLTWLWTTLQTAGIALVVLTLLAAPSIVLAVVRARRSRRRRDASTPAARVSGGWREMVDRAADLGQPMPGGRTRREEATALDGRFPEAGFTTLGARADTAVFGAGEPTAAEVADYWADVRTATRRLERQTPRLRRWRARLWPASVLPQRLRRGGRA